MFHIKYVFILPTVQVQAGRGARQEGWFPWKAPHSCDFGATGDYYNGASGNDDICGGVDIYLNDDENHYMIRLDSETRKNFLNVRKMFLIWQTLIQKDQNLL